MDTKAIEYIKTRADAELILKELSRAYEQYPVFRKSVDGGVSLHRSIGGSFSWREDPSGGAFWASVRLILSKRGLR